MSDSNPEMNSAEEEAEKILMDAVKSLDANGNDCPLGEDCAVHHRNDEEVIDEDTKFGRIMTYAGDYLIATSDNPELDDPFLIMKMLSGRVEQEDIPPMYETCVIWVGEGALADTRMLNFEDQVKSIRFIQKHNEWSNFRAAHDLVVESVKSGLLDLSKPASEREN